jgi:hypothetical protein
VQKFPASCVCRFGYGALAVGRQTAPERRRWHLCISRHLTRIVGVSHRVQRPDVELSRNEISEPGHQRNKLLRRTTSRPALGSRFLISLLLGGRRGKLSTEEGLGSGSVCGTGWYTETMQPVSPLDNFICLGFSKGERPMAKGGIGVNGTTI